MKYSKYIPLVLVFTVILTFIIISNITNKESETYSSIQIVLNGTILHGINVEGDSMLPTLNNSSFIYFKKENDINNVIENQLIVLKFRETLICKRLSIKQGIKYATSDNAVLGIEFPISQAKLIGVVETFVTNGKTYRWNCEKRDYILVE